MRRALIAIAALIAAALIIITAARPLHEGTAPTSDGRCSASFPVICNR